MKNPVLYSSHSFDWNVELISGHRHNWPDVSKLRLMISQADPGVFQVFTDSTFPSKLVFKAGHCCQKSTHTPLSHLWWWITRMREATLFSLWRWQFGAVDINRPYVQDCSSDMSGASCWDKIVSTFWNWCFSMPHASYVHLTVLFRFLHFTIFQHYNLAQLVLKRSIPQSFWTFPQASSCVYAIDSNCCSLIVCLYLFCPYTAHEK